ncbi:hypothetical protein [Planomonospora sp. ID82291]|uniref:hypothetical protein n=1 Tax=Planomonospora sp. ID82291 TaxID=2738136 RepID=UPI0018C3F2F0|nr:hypothetical protein [Planomonospora sp. ID82291]MBG0815020.1 hypothetical protein [Planomonospora sp. ID82291]
MAEAAPRQEPAGARAADREEPAGARAADREGSGPGGRCGREELARAQAELLAALVAGAQAPPGFDGERLRIQAASLVAKRRSLVARLRPDLVQALGEGFRAEFAAYASGRPRPPGGSRADAADFAEHLARTGRIAAGNGIAAGNTTAAGNAAGNTTATGNGTRAGGGAVADPSRTPGRWARLVRWLVRWLGGERETREGDGR